ncbi:uncharacterized protein LOC108451233 [Gossypium arboreum]|uniref:uncharacterized protein LOC108451233 n=1 Tax=Gossypium arboreum TaxID=29729 RepID=UPI00081936E6|nr:uncharacterized protein LOC108451233 [Gossypium arboreum]
MEFLSKRGVNIQNFSIFCSWCEREPESASHMFFKCRFMEGFWDKIFNWWDVVWKRVDGFVEYFSLCYNVKLDERKKRLWLISIAAACWTIWIARNGLVFDGRRVNMANLVFQSKMRALLWIRSNHNEIMLQEKFWWLAPQRCCVVSHKSNAVVSFWRLPPCGWLKFNVCGIAKEDKARGGGILRDMEGIAREIFSGAVGTNVAEEAEIGAVKFALEAEIFSGY